jgi:hypothetical protein
MRVCSNERVAPHLAGHDGLLLLFMVAVVAGFQGLRPGVFVFWDLYSFLLVPSVCAHGGPHLWFSCNIATLSNGGCAVVYADAGTEGASAVSEIEA